jgi:hypothetical protein
LTPIATADFTGICPACRRSRAVRARMPQWDVCARSACLPGRWPAGMAQLDRDGTSGKLPKVDVLLAQKYAGAAGKARRAVTIEWDDVKDMTPWRYGLTIAVGLSRPRALMKAPRPRYDYDARRPRRCWACRPAPPARTARPARGVSCPARRWSISTARSMRRTISRAIGPMRIDAARCLCRGRVRRADGGDAQLWNGGAGRGSALFAAGADRLCRRAPAG